MNRYSLAYNLFFYVNALTYTHMHAKTRTRCPTTWTKPPLINKRGAGLDISRERETKGEMIAVSLFSGVFFWLTYVLSKKGHCSLAAPVCLCVASTAAISKCKSFTLPHKAARSSVRSALVPMNASWRCHSRMANYWYGCVMCACPCFLYACVCVCSCVCMVVCVCVMCVCVCACVFVRMRRV